MHFFRFFIGFMISLSLIFIWAFIDALLEGDETAISIAYIIGFCGVSYLIGYIISYLNYLKWRQNKTCLLRRNNMKLKEFILQRGSELIASGLYKDVQFISAIDVGLKKNSTLEKFLSTNSDVDKQGEEVRYFSLLPDVNAEDNGSKIRFEVLPKGKRKYRTETFYFLYT